MLYANRCSENVYYGNCRFPPCLPSPLRHSRRDAPLNYININRKKARGTTLISAIICCSPRFNLQRPGWKIPGAMRKTKRFYVPTQLSPHRPPGHHSILLRPRRGQQTAVALPRKALRIRRFPPPPQAVVDHIRSCRFLLRCRRSSTGHLLATVSRAPLLRRGPASGPRRQIWRLAEKPRLDTLRPRFCCYCEGFSC